MRGVLILGVIVARPLSWSAPASQKLSEAQRQQAIQRLDSLPLSFIENQGQSDPAVAYYLQRPGFQAYFTTKGVALRLTEGQGEAAWACGLQIELVGASAKAAIEPVERAPGVVSYFTGSCEQWKTGIPTVTEIAYRQPWPGVDLHYRGQEGRLEAVYVVAPGADPAAVRLRYVGQEALKLDEAGNLVLATALGEVKFSAPILYQEITGRRVPVDGRFMLAGAETVAFHVAAYDHQHPLIIDHTLAYAGYIGGSSSEYGYGIAVDTTGAAYVTGNTGSAEATFPVTVGPDLTYNGGGDAFVAKVNPSGTALSYAGYIGGSLYDGGWGIALDSTGAAYVTGDTTSIETTFPVTVEPDLTYNGRDDAFVAKVNPSGTALSYAGYMFESVEEALREMGAGLPDVILLDIHLPGIPGSEGVRVLQEKYPSVQVLMLTNYADEDMVFDSICNGAHGYLLKKTPPARLLEAIREAREGGAPMSPEIARKVVRLFQKTMPPKRIEHQLTPHEVRILGMLAEGYSYQGVATRLSVSINTIRNHIRSIYDKLHVHSKSEAVCKALKHRVISRRGETPPLPGPVEPEKNAVAAESVADPGRAEVGVRADAPVRPLPQHRAGSIQLQRSHLPGLHGAPMALPV